MVIYMKDYRKAKAAKVAEHVRYDEELLCVNWNPAISLIAKTSYQTAQELSPQLPDDDAAIDEAFLTRVYALSGQI
jgi:hypothetical protein